MADLNKIIDELSKLTVVEAAELLNSLKKMGCYSSSSSSSTSGRRSCQTPAEEKANLRLLLLQQETKKLM